MARQEIKLGEFWSVVFNKLNENFSELFAGQENAVDTEQLTNALASYVTSTAMAEAISSFITATDLTNALADYMKTTEFTAQIANYVTNSGLSTTLAGYVTSTAFTEALANKVSKISGKDLSTNDYTNEDKAKLAGLKAPTKQEFTANSWGTADSNGVYSYTITSTQSVAAVYRANGSNYENAAVAISVNGNTITLITEETFAGYAILV